MLNVEWTVWDDEKGIFKFVRAATWKEAVIEGMKLGVKPRCHLDVRPRTGNRDAVRDREEFREFMSKVSGS